MTAPAHEPDQHTAGYLLCAHSCGWWIPYPTSAWAGAARFFLGEHEKRCPARPPRTIGDMPW